MRGEGGWRGIEGGGGKWLGSLPKRVSGSVRRAVRLSTLVCPALFPSDTAFQPSA